MIVESVSCDTLCARIMWFAAACAVFVIGQFTESANAESFKPMAFRHLVVADGLSQNTIMDVLQDSHGYMWFATENGLDRYDGYTIKSYQRGSAELGDLTNDYIWAIEEDTQQDLWLATDGGGVARWHRQSNRFEHFKHEPGVENSLSSNRIRSLKVTPDGIWIGTLDAGLNFLDVKTFEVTRFPHDPADPLSIPSDEIYDLLEDDLGRLWVGTDKGVAWLQKGTKRFTRLTHDPNNRFSLSHDRVRALFQDRHGGIWVGTFGGGLNLLDRRSGQFKRFMADSDRPGSISNDHVRDIMEDATGRLWVATAEGLNMLPPYSSDFWVYQSGPARHQLTDSYIMSLYQDRGGVLWVGTRSGGVNSWNSDSWYFGHFEADWLRQKSVTAFATSPDRLWVSTFEGGLSGIDRTTGNVDHIDLPNEAETPESIRVMSLLVDGQERLWVGTMNHGLISKTKHGEWDRQVQDSRDPSTLSSNSIMSLFQDSAGAIWVGTFGDGINRFVPETGENESFLPITDDNPKGFCATQGRDFAEDANGNLWIATENGLCLLDLASRQFTVFRRGDGQPENLPENSVYALHRDSQDRIWAGTGGGGLSMVVGSSRDPETIRFETLTRKAGISSNMIFGIQSEEEGPLWLSSNNGLTRFDPSTLEVSNYRRTHGLQGDEFHYGASHQSSDGQLYFGGANGFNEFDPRRVRSARSAPNLVLSNVLKMNRAIDLQMPMASLSHLNLGYRENAVTLEFAALDFTEPANNRYEFLLEGFDPGWIETDARRATTYTNLDGGEYVLRVRAKSGDGSWQTESSPLHLTVAPPPWLTLWAYFAYAGLALGLLGFSASHQRRRAAHQIAYQRQLEGEVERRTGELKDSNRSLRKLSKAKGEFLARMSHEIRSPMNGIVGIADLLTRTGLTEQQRGYAQTIRGSVTSLVHIINDILDYSKLDAQKMTLDPVSTDLERLLSEIVRIFAIQAESEKVELCVRMPPEGLPHVLVDALRLRQIVTNLLSNALKFTDKGYVELSLSIEHQEGEGCLLAIEVKDTGIGIAPANQVKIFESFAQEDRSISRRFGGTGLGLSICKELIELMAGQLTLESTLGQGSTFHIDVPVEHVDLPEMSETHHAPIPMRALVVSARPRITELLRHYIEGWQGEVSAVCSLADAVQALSGPNAKPIDLIVADQDLGDYMSLELFQRLDDAQLAAGTPRLLLVPPSDEAPNQNTNYTTMRLPLVRTELWTHLTAIFKGERIEHQFDTIETQLQSDLLQGDVLLVEDNPVNQEVFASMLDSLGCQVTIAQDGVTGVRLTKQGNHSLILMDYRLPDIDGIEATKRIRKLPDDRSLTPIIALTANASTDDQQRCLAAGMDGFLAKPCSLEMLETTLSHWLPRQVPARTATESVNDDLTQFDEFALRRVQQLKQADGSSMLPRAIRLFHTLADDALEKIEKAIDASDAYSLGFAAHKLKSGCANLGAANMAHLCREIEEHARKDQFAETSKILDRLHSERKALNEWLENCLRRQDVASA